MSGFPKFLEMFLKITGSVLLTLLIIYFMGDQHEKQNIVAAKAFDGLRNTMLSLIPGEKSDEEKKSPDTKGTGDILTAGENPDAIPETAEPQESIGFREPDRQRAVELAGKAESVSADQKVEIPPELPKHVVLLEHRTIPTREDSLEQLQHDSRELERQEDKKGIYVKELDFDLKSLDDLISKALEVSLNEIEISDDQVEILINTLQNAEEYFDIEDIDLDEIADYTRRISMFTSLKDKIRRIAVNAGADEECGFHIPKLELNEKLEITGYYQIYDCHPELVEKIMTRIKRLPEWRRLVKK